MTIQAWAMAISLRLALITRVWGTGGAADHVLIRGPLHVHMGGPVDCVLPLSLPSSHISSRPPLHPAAHLHAHSLHAHSLHAHSGRRQCWSRTVARTVNRMDRRWPRVNGPDASVNGLGGCGVV